MKKVRASPALLLFYDFFDSSEFYILNYIYKLSIHIPIMPTIPIIESVLPALNQTNASFFFYYADGGKIGCHFYRAGHGTVHADV